MEPPSSVSLSFFGVGPVGFLAWLVLTDDYPFYPGFSSSGSSKTPPKVLSSKIMELSEFILGINVV